MPGNNQIALAIEPLQLEGPLSQYAKAAQVGNMIQQSREHAQRMEQRDLQIDKQRRDAADQENWRGAYMEGMGNREKTKEAALRRNVKPETIQNYEKQWDDDIERKSKLKELDFKNSDSLTEELFNAHEFVAGLPEEQRPQAWDMKSQQLVKRGLIKPEHVEPYDPARFPLSRAMATTQKHTKDGAIEKRAAAEELRKQQDQDRENKLAPFKQAAAESNALTAANTAELGGLKVQGREPEQPHEKAAREETERRNKETAAQATQRLLLTKRGQDMTDTRAREKNANKPGKPLPIASVKSLETKATLAEQVASLADTFKDEYGGNPFTGSLETWIGKLGGEDVGLTDKGQTGWWQAYQDYKNSVRHGTFGAALSKTEKDEWEKAVIDHRSAPSVIRTNLAKQKTVTDKAIRRAADTYKAGGYNQEQIDLYRPESADPKAPAPTGGSGAPKTAEEYLKSIGR